jgi:hypothetical protein
MLGCEQFVPHTHVRRLLPCTSCSFDVWDVILETEILPFSGLTCWFAVRYIALGLHYQTLSETNIVCFEKSFNRGRNSYIFLSDHRHYIVSILTASLNNQLKSEFPRIIAWAPLRRILPAGVYSVSRESTEGAEEDCSSGNWARVPHTKQE